MPAGDIWQLSCDQTLDGVALTNVHYFRQIDADTVPVMGAELALAYFTTIQPVQLNCQNPNLLVVQYRARRVAPVPSQPVVFLSGVNGTRAGACLAPNIPALLSFFSLPGGAPIPRTRVAKTFLSALNEDDFIDGVWNAALRILIEAFADALLGVLISPAGTSFEKIVWDTAAGVARKTVLREVRSSTRKLRSRTKTA